jgi:hypothetical protein
MTSHQEARRDQLVIRRCRRDEITLFSRDEMMAMGEEGWQRECRKLGVADLEPTPRALRAAVPHESERCKA